MQAYTYMYMYVTLVSERPQWFINLLRPYMLSEGMDICSVKSEKELLYDQGRAGNRV